MLIVTSNAVPDPATLGETDGWAEPHVLVVLPGSGWTRAELRATQASATVIEYLQRPAGTIRVMQDVLDAMRQTVRQPKGSLAGGGVRHPSSQPPNHALRTSGRR